MKIIRHVFACFILLSGASVGMADDTRTVTVSGIGSVSVAPDIARLQLSVVERSESLTAAQQAATDVTARTLKLLDKLKIDRKYVNTTGASVRPDYRWNRSKEEQEMVGYIAERSIQIELRELDKLGELLEGAVGAGVNQVLPPVLDSSKSRKAYREALALAAADARENAATLAVALGARLGDVIEINANEIASPRPMMRMQAADMMIGAESAPQTYNAGDLRFEVQVLTVFALTD